jgi:endonuclease G
MKLIYLILAIFITTANAQAADSCDSMTPFGKPVVKTVEKATRLCRKMYVLEHSPSRHTAFWSAEHLIGTEQGTGAERINAFKADPDLPITEAARPSDYAKSGYDQGHMAPVGDMHKDADAMLESFYLSNMVPQNPLNNRDGWNHLEYYVRGLSIKNNEAYVITGPVYQCVTCVTIGKSKVMIPTHLYKVVYLPSRKLAISFLVPNVPFTDKDIPKYITTIKDIQKATSIKFFPLLTVPVDEAKAML